MPCSFCRHIGHNVRTCPLSRQMIREQREAMRQMEREHASAPQTPPFAPQTPPDSPHASSPSPTSVITNNILSQQQRERIRQMEIEQQQRQQQRRQAEAQRRHAESQRRQAEAERRQARAQRQEAIMVDIITEEQQSRDAAIDHSLQQIQNWSRRLQREVDNRRSLELPQSKKSIKLKMIENMDNYYNTENCPVCLDPYNDSSKSRVTSACKHIVCCECMTELMKRKKHECPCCRTSFKEVHILPGINMDTFNTISAVL